MQVATSLHPLLPLPPSNLCPIHSIVAWFFNQRKTDTTMKISFLFLCFLLPVVTAQLRVGFYNSTSPRAEQIVRDAVQKHFHGDPSITAALLRMHFHDCFVRKLPVLELSCAGVITLATRDAVALARGPKYSVPTGRRDGTVSDPSLVNLPRHTLSVSQALGFFKAKRLALNNM
ncbi:unnamed protein product, partial [Thlaspi arvense]